MEWVSVVFLLLPHISHPLYLSFTPCFLPSYRRCRRWNSEWVSRWRKSEKRRRMGKHNRGVFPQTPIFFWNTFRATSPALMLYTKSTNITNVHRRHITETIPAHKKISERRRSPKNVYEWDSSLIFRIRSEQKISYCEKKTSSGTLDIRRGYRTLDWHSCEKRMRNEWHKHVIIPHPLDIHCTFYSLPMPVSPKKHVDSFFISLCL